MGELAEEGCVAVDVGFSDKGLVDKNNIINKQRFAPQEPSADTETTINKLILHLCQFSSKVYCNRQCNALVECIS